MILVFISDVGSEKVAFMWFGCREIELENVVRFRNRKPVGHCEGGRVDRFECMILRTSCLIYVLRAGNSLKLDGHRQRPNGIAFKSNHFLGTVHVYRLVYIFFNLFVCLFGNVAPFLSVPEVQKSFSYVPDIRNICTQNLHHI